MGAFQIDSDGFTSAIYVAAGGRIPREAKAGWSELESPPARLRASSARGQRRSALDHLQSPKTFIQARTTSFLWYRAFCHRTRVVAMNLRTPRDQSWNVEKKSSHQEVKASTLFPRAQTNNTIRAITSTKVAR